MNEVKLRLRVASSTHQGARASAAFVALAWESKRAGVKLPDAHVGEDHVVVRLLEKPDGRRDSAACVRGDPVQVRLQPLDAELVAHHSRNRILSLVLSVRRPVRLGRAASVLRRAAKATVAVAKYKVACKALRAVRDDVRARNLLQLLARRGATVPIPLSVLAVHALVRKVVEKPPCRRRLDEEVLHRLRERRGE